MVVHPQEIAKNAQIRALLARLVPAERFDAFRRTTGVDLRELGTAIIAGFDDSTLYLADTGARTAEATRRFDERLTGEAKHVRSHARVERIYGMLGPVPETLVSVEGAFIAVSVGDPMPARITELMVAGKLRTPSALHGVALSSLPDDLASAPSGFMRPDHSPENGRRLVEVYSALRRRLVSRRGRTTRYSGFTRSSPGDGQTQIERRSRPPGAI